MAEFKGTPGPWVKDYGGTIGHIKSTGVPSGLTPTVARYDIRLVSRSDEEQEANGHLIAAALDLLKAVVGPNKGHTRIGALQALLNDIRQNTDAMELLSNGNLVALSLAMNECQGLVNDSRTAIAKALGEGM